MKFLVKICAAAALALTAGAANASTVYSVATTGEIGSLTCDKCSWVDTPYAWVGSEYDLSDRGSDGSGSLSTGSTVELFNIDPNDNSEENEILNLNRLVADLSLDSDDFSRDAVVGSWTGSDTGWTIFKFGQGTQEDERSHLFVFNYGGNISYSGKALSHVTYGECAEGGLYTATDCGTTVVPLPAAGWLLLGGLGGLAALRRRKKA